MLGRWLVNAREELKARKELERVREYLPVYYDPTRKTTVFGPGAPLTSQAAIERAIQPAKPVRAIAGQPMRLEAAAGRRSARLPRGSTHSRPVLLQGECASDTL